MTDLVDRHGNSDFGVVHSEATVNHQPRDVESRLTYVLLWLRQKTTGMQREAELLFLKSCSPQYVMILYLRNVSWGEVCLGRLIHLLGVHDCPCMYVRHTWKVVCSEEGL